MTDVSQIQLVCFDSIEKNRNTWKVNNIDDINNKKEEGNDDENNINSVEEGDNDQKTKETYKWNDDQLNKLHVVIVLLCFIMYFGHIINSPFIKFIDNEVIILFIKVTQTICLIISILCFVKMHGLIGSKVVMKLMLSKKNIRGYIYLFWIIRSFIMEICKGQIMYSFIHVFHSILIYSTDTWYVCNQKILAVNICLFLLILIYEFSISISPLAPKVPEWTLFHVNTNPNNLSRSNQFNLFVIFFDALVIVVHDSKRSKFVMLSKKRDRFYKIVTEKERNTIRKLWKILAVLFFISVTIFVLNPILQYCKDSYTWNTSSCVIYNVTFIIFTTPGIILAMFIFKYSSVELFGTYKKLIQERRIIFIVILLIILCYVDNYKGPNAPGIMFPIVVGAFISFDVIGEGTFPKRVSRFVMTILILVLLWNIFRFTFLSPYCDEIMFPWGLGGENISYCTIKRIIHSSLLSLMAKAFTCTVMGYTNKMFFCNANTYRSTGTNSISRRNEKFVNRMLKEKQKITQSN